MWWRTPILGISYDPENADVHRNLALAILDYDRAVGSNADAAARAAHPRRQTELNLGFVLHYHNLSVYIWWRQLTGPIDLINRLYFCGIIFAGTNNGLRSDKHTCVGFASSLSEFVGSANRLTAC
jgi:hypothetical protein